MFFWGVGGRQVRRERTNIQVAQTIEQRCRTLIEVCRGEKTGRKVSEQGLPPSLRIDGNAGTDLHHSCEQGRVREHGVAGAEQHRWPSAVQCSDNGVVQARGTRRVVHHLNVVRKVACVGERVPSRWWACQHRNRRQASMPGFVDQAQQGVVEQRLVRAHALASPPRKQKEAHHAFTPGRRGR